MGLVYLPQESSVFGKLTEDNVRAIAQTKGLKKSEEDDLVQNRLDELNLAHLAQKVITEWW